MLAVQTGAGILSNITSTTGVAITVTATIHVQYSQSIVLMFLGKNKVINIYILRISVLIIIRNFEVIFSVCKWGPESQ